MGGQSLVVPDSAPVAGDPRQCPLHHPPAGQDLKGVQIIGPFHDLQGQAQAGLGPGDQLPGVAAIGPGELDRGEGPPQVPQQRPGGVAVLDGRGGDQDGQQQAERIDGDVPLGSIDLLGVIPVPG